MLTPNRSEFREVAGGWKSEAELNCKAERLRKELQLEALLVTRSEEGMSLYRANEILHEPTQSREVFDVSGAGDTVIATLAVMLACGAECPMRCALPTVRRVLWSASWVRRWSAETKLFRIWQARISKAGSK